MPTVSMATIAFRAWKQRRGMEVYGSIQRVGVDGGVAVGARLTLAAVKVNMGRKMTASLASGILVQTAANTVMMAPD